MTYLLYDCTLVFYPDGPRSELGTRNSFLRPRWITTPLPTFLAVFLSVGTHREVPHRKYCHLAHEEAKRSGGDWMLKEQEHNSGDEGET